MTATSPVISSNITPGATVEDAIPSGRKASASRRPRVTRSADAEFGFDRRRRQPRSGFSDLERRGVISVSTSTPGLLSISTGPILLSRYKPFDTGVTLLGFRRKKRKFNRAQTSVGGVRTQSRGGTSKKVGSVDFPSEEPPPLAVEALDALTPNISSTGPEEITLEEMEEFGLE